MKFYYSQFKAMYKEQRKKMRLAKGFQYVFECQGGMTTKISHMARLVGDTILFRTKFNLVPNGDQSF